MFRKFNSRWFIVIAILGFFNIFGYSQREDTAIINIKYKLTYLADTTRR
jgi:predicted negative regulator of RcsB-dependent stress response